MLKIVSTGFFIFVIATVFFTVFFIAGHVLQWFGLSNLPAACGFAGVVIFLMAWVVWYYFIAGKP